MFLFLFLILFKNDGIVLSALKVSFIQDAFYLDLGLFPDLNKKEIAYI